MTWADDSNNRVACTDHVRSSLSLADNLTNKHVTTRSPFYTVHAHRHTHRNTQLSVKDLKAHAMQVLVWIITARLLTVTYTHAVSASAKRCKYIISPCSHFWQVSQHLTVCTFSHWLLILCLQKYLIYESKTSSESKSTSQHTVPPYMSSFSTATNWNISKNPPLLQNVPKIWTSGTLVVRENTTRQANSQYMTSVYWKDLAAEILLMTFYEQHSVQFFM